MEEAARSEGSGTARGTSPKRASGNGMILMVKSKQFYIRQNYCYW
jgi:hypothetical protein